MIIYVNICAVNWLPLLRAYCRRQSVMRLRREETTNRLESMMMTIAMEVVLMLAVMMMTNISR